jgi:phosphatidylserine/phosphatidylglycerophosphate/cardiolipin synthase-like enzyme/uncharacterized membrane protein YdjX (TVP38/TMEM64 family)
VILREGTNCWRVEQASRASYLIDAAAYYARFREVVLGARRSVMILGWDVDSRTPLVPSAIDGWPTTLLALLKAVLADRPALRAYVLGWDFSMIYTLEREKLPAYRFASDGHERLLFRLDATQPVGASHHQKVVVVDDEVAFTGGIDLTIRRWDTERHPATDADRVDPGGAPYTPMHDVQMMVEGPVARALGELARQRWQGSGGGALPALPAPPATGGSLWPRDLAPDMSDVPLAIARTLPDVREVLQLTIDSIRHARRWIYLESQYLTSAAVGAALATSLEAADGPEVVAVLPREECGWLERSSMGVLRARLLRRLRAADRHGRLRLYHPTLPDLGAADCLNVHSKIMVIDDELARVGSANLSNRSMSLDTECDLALDADGDPRRGAVVAALRDRLLAEHLGTDAATVAARLGARRSLIGAIDSLRGGPRSLEPLPEALADDEPALNFAMLDGLVCDPERPAPGALFDVVVPAELRPPLGRSLVRWALAIAVIVSLVTVWYATPLAAYLDAERIAALGRQVRDSPAAPLWVMGAYLLGSLVLFPITLLLTATALLFPPGQSIAYCLSGTLAAAALGHGVGRLLRRSWRPGLGPRWLRRPRVQRLRRQLAERGILAIVAARLLPVGSFSLINMLAGAIPVRFRDFMIGNLLGILPGVLGLTVFAQGLGRVVRNPGPRNLAALALLAVAIIAGLGWIRRRVERATQTAAGRS